MFSKNKTKKTLKCSPKEFAFCTPTKVVFNYFHAIAILNMDNQINSEKAYSTDVENFFIHEDM